MTTFHWRIRNPKTPKTTEKDMECNDLTAELNDLIAIYEQKIEELKEKRDAIFNYAQSFFIELGERAKEIEQYQEKLNNLKEKLGDDE